MVLGSSPFAVTWTSDFVSVLSKEFLDIQAIIECGFNLKLVRDMIRTYNQFESFKENLELNLESAVRNNPFLVVLLGDINAKSSKWCKNHITRSEGKAIENVSSQFGLHQVSNEPTHILESYSSSIDLIVTSQPKLITGASVHPFLYPNSHHQIILENLTWKFVFRHLILATSGTTKMQILILSDKQLICLIETGLS